MAIRGAAPFATFLIIGSTCFFLGIVFALLPYDYYVLWSSPPAPADSTTDPMEDYFLRQEEHLKFLHASPPLISQILHIVIGVGMLGLMMKLYKPNEANMLFDGASLVLYVCGIVVYVANIVKGLRTVTANAYGGLLYDEDGNIAQAGIETSEGEYIGREDSLRVLAASNTILALVLVGILILQAGQWYAQRKDSEELERMDKARDEKKKLKEGGKKKQ